MADAIKSHSLMNAHLLQRSAQIITDIFDKSKWAFLLTPVFMFFQTYIFNDFDYLKWLVVLIALDTALGFGLAIGRREIDKDRFGDILIKIIVYSSCLVVGHVLENFTVSGDTIPGGDYMKLLIYVAIIIKEAISVLDNAGKISKKLVPQFILARLKGFDETGDFKNFKDAKSNQDTKS
ncbi:Bacteriophage holin family protein [Cyclobacterium xiamenense]|uniref:Bacteriophage holin family protein n=1 Tax=Cyclobacterium xiamenense TaxID=1297121 RepID=A0A1H6WEV3_9BACT|nr:phage holin family protein [Cyclobacterium xiamenense]SEJ15559.1 Bacteriophage holin family protein [Cyclobacterium xiamenense]